MNCPLQDYGPCGDESNTACVTEFVGNGAMLKCRRTGKKFLLITEETYCHLQARLALLDKLQHRVLADHSCEYRGTIDSLRRYYGTIDSLETGLD